MALFYKDLNQVRECLTGYLTYLQYVAYHPEQEGLIGHSAVMIKKITDSEHSFHEIISLVWHVMTFEVQKQSFPVCPILDVFRDPTVDLIFTSHRDLFNLRCNLYMPINSIEGVLYDQLVELFRDVCENFKIMTVAESENWIQEKSKINSTFAFSNH
jgi:hypothetical protein